MVQAKRVFPFIFLLILIFGLSGCNQEKVTVTDPFKISLADVSIYEGTANLPDSTTAENTPCLRLKLTVDISNSTSHRLSDTWFEITLNEEAIALIRSGVLSTNSGDPVDIYSKEEAAGTPDKGWAFSHEWNPMLSSMENFSPSDISEYIKSITVTVHWNGGSQTKVLPITFTQEHFDIIENFK